jgi:hypothetical protein
MSCLANVFRFTEGYQRLQREGTEKKCNNWSFLLSFFLSSPAKKGSILDKLYNSPFIVIFTTLIFIFFSIFLLFTFHRKHYFIVFILDVLPNTHNKHLKNHFRYLDLDIKSGVRRTHWQGRLHLKVLFKREMVSHADCCRERWMQSGSFWAPIQSKFIFSHRTQKIGCSVGPQTMLR